MGAEVAIPVWVFLLAWALVGLIVGGPMLNRAATPLIVTPSARGRVRLALGIGAAGPFVWAVLGGSMLAALVEHLCRRLRSSREEGETHGG
jgi:MFS family permease